MIRLDLEVLYASALSRLTTAASVFVFVCDCSRKEIALDGADAFNEETPYPGRCRDRGLEPAPGRGIRSASILARSAS